MNSPESDYSNIDPDEVKKAYMNKAQLDAAIVDANEMYHVMGRGTGKTNGIITYRFMRAMFEMPGSSGFIIHETYQGLLTRILPSFVAGLARMGWYKGYHYEIGKRLKGAPEPIEPPLKYEYFIHCMNGSGVHLISQDRIGSSNGLNTDYGGGDEAKYLDYEQYTEETVPTMRANRTLFEKHHLWQSQTFTTSMPTATDAKWILKKDSLVNQELIAKIREMSTYIMNLRYQRSKYSPSSSNFIRLTQLIARYEQVISMMRIGDRDKDDPTIYTSRFSSLENIAVLGEGYIRKMKRLLPDFQFRTEIINEEVKEVEGGFYPNLSIERHTYKPVYDNATLESFHYNMDKIAEANTSAIDLDCDAYLPINLTIDLGADITSMTIAQDLPHEYRFINNMYVKHPELIKHLATKFTEYYSSHRRKDVFLPYYGTETARVLNSTYTYIEEFALCLRAAGWYVTTSYMGQQPTHADRYLFFHNLLARDWEGKPVTWNRRKCKEALNSMLMAQVKQTQKGIAKDKSSEGKKGVPQEEATHFSDSVDTHIDYAYMRKGVNNIDYLSIR